MKNKVCIITGCSSGIGKATAIALAKKEHHILMLVRDGEKANKAFKEIKSASNRAKVTQYGVDLSSFSSIRQTVEQIKVDHTHIDVLINNAGIYKRKRELSDDGFEMTLAVNYLALFGLTEQLKPLLKRARQARIINLTSGIYKRGEILLENGFEAAKYNENKAYANSKLLVIYYTKYLAKTLKDQHITVNCLHPGFVGTSVFREYPKWFSSLLNALAQTPEQAAKSAVELATSNNYNNTSGKYFNKIKEEATSKVANNEALESAIYNRSYEICSKTPTNLILKNPNS